MTRPAIERRDPEALPREFEECCRYCDGSGVRKRFNGAHFQKRRQLANLTLTEIARMFGGKVSVCHLSRMESGHEPFLPKYAEFYDQLLERRGRSGQDW